MRSLQLVISCVSPSVVRILEDSGAGISLSPGASLSLGDELVAVTRQWVVPVSGPESRSWEARLVGYSYELYRGHDELFLYHWHPQGPSHLVDPHLHPGPPLLAALGTKRAVHLPTGEIRLSDFVTMLIREFGVRARRGTGVRSCSP